MTALAALAALAALTALCPPPESVPPAPDWNQVERELGMRLPQDYKELVATYGPGQFCGFISLHQPYGAGEWTDLTGPLPARLREQIEQVRHSTRTPWPLPHDPQHLFAMGTTANGDYLFWVTQPDTTPDAWAVAVNEALRAPWFTYPGTLTDFLLAILTGTTQVPIFPTDLLTTGTAFIPAAVRDTPAPQHPPRGPANTNTNTIRTWARANGHDLPHRGRIPLDILHAWEAANPT
ncbi:Lsr2 family protein [Streptomyces sp. NBC_00536]|uniref:Lsr2 family DNA-binding protein n=1 Tax=Streptomyces sp. NBC_00536 TaxID=2975769 RepID=UPI002E807F7D|nr:histone-like nucleoid-structuring protein Lsr2 [Streptomyces sp. NBC_00536]WUC83165.1 Lsr2 family protein [Streptomyces sp. NBC_00536]